MGGLSSKKKEYQPLLRDNTPPEKTNPEKKVPEKKVPEKTNPEKTNPEKETRKRSDSYPPRTFLRCLAPPEHCPHCQLEFALQFICNRIAEAEKAGVNYSNLSIFTRAPYWLRAELIKKLVEAKYKVYQDHYNLPKELQPEVNKNSPLLMVVWDK